MPTKWKRQKKDPSHPTGGPLGKKLKQSEFLTFLRIVQYTNKLATLSPDLPITPKQCACTHCQNRKVKCEQDGFADCRACIVAGVQCVPVGPVGPAKSKSTQSQSVVSDCSHCSKSPESNYQTTNMDDKCCVSSQSEDPVHPEHTIGKLLLR